MTILPEKLALTVLAVVLGFFIVPNTEAATIISQSVSSASIQETNVTGSAEDSMQDNFSANTAGQILLSTACGVSGMSVQATTSTTTSNTAFSLVAATYKFTNTSSSAQNVSPKSNVGGCVAVLEAWSNAARKTSFDGNYSIKFIFPASEWNKFVTGQTSLYTFSTSSNQWVVIPGVVINESARTLEAQLNHMTLFGALGTLVSTSVSSATSSTAASVSTVSGSFPSTAAVITTPIPGVTSPPPVVTASPHVVTPGVIFPPAVTRPTVPISLFDISAVIDKQSYTTFEEPQLRILFDNFGKQPTKVNLTITVANAAGRLIAKYTDAVVIETTGVYVKKLKKLPEGVYRVAVETNYGENVRDSFRLSFEVVPTPGEGLRGVKDQFILTIKLMPLLAWAWLATAISALVLAYLLRVFIKK